MTERTPGRPAPPGQSSGLREPAQSARTTAPLIDVYETDTAFVVIADVPGVRAEGLEVTADRETLTIRGRVSRPDRPPERQEFELVDYFQTLALTDDLDPAHVNASLKDGVLRVTVPKSPGVQPRKIQIHTE